MSLFLVFLVYICTVVTEIRGDVNDVPLWNIDAVENTNKLFTGMAYQIQDPLDATCNLVWDKESQMFRMKHIKTPLDTSAIFYLVHATSGYYYVKNAALKGAENLVTKCMIKEDGKTDLCYLTIERTNPEDQILYTCYHFRPENEDGGPEQTTILPNSYFLDQSAGDIHFEYDASVEWDKNPHIQLRFVHLVKLESELIGIKTTSPPTNTPDCYISQNQKQLWKETIINPTAMSRQKTFRQQTVEVPSTETITPKTAPEFPFSTSTRHKRSTTPEKPKTVDMEERITIPPYTCMEVHLMTQPETIVEQDIDAQLKVIGKVTRFVFANGAMRESKLVPGIVVEQVLKEQKFEGKYVETRESEAIYEISGKLTSERGIHSTVISREIDCPNTNKKDPHAPHE